jgi:hypothetical protein
LQQLQPQAQSLPEHTSQVHTLQLHCAFEQLLIFTSVFMILFFILN